MKTEDRRRSLLRELSETWVLQRLRHIELSAVPGWVGSRVATASRFQHSLSVGELSLMVSGSNRDEKMLLTAAATLHDVGVGPFPHLSDHVMREVLGFSHEEAVEFAFESSPLRDRHVLDSYGLDLSEISSIIGGHHRLSRFLHGFPDLDNADNIYRFIISTPGRPLGEPSYKPSEIACAMSLDEDEQAFPEELKERWMRDFVRTYSYLWDDRLNMIGWTMLGRALRILRDEMSPGFFRLTNKEAYALIRLKIPRLAEGLERREFRIILDRRYLELRGEAKRLAEPTGIRVIEETLCRESGVEDWMIGLTADQP
ncbi:MAG: phosphohydrolase, partial [Candidatus Bathyarchaeota archaeon B63]